MKGTMQYKGYVGSARYSDQDEVFHGKLEGIRDVVTYKASDVRRLKKSLHDAVDDYLTTCARKKRAPGAPFKGSFNVREALERYLKTESA